jgi:hypothetical protein
LFDLAQDAKSQMLKMKTDTFVRQENLQIVHEFIWCFVRKKYKHLTQLLSSEKRLFFLGT